MKMNKNLVMLLVVGGIGLYIWNRKKKGLSINPFSSFTGYEDSEFFNVTGRPSPKNKVKSLYTAGGYDPNHMNGDGTRGATWIAYNNNTAQGYWVKGVVRQGTAM